MRLPRKKLGTKKKTQALLELVKDFDLMYKLKVGESKDLTNPLGKFTITKLEEGNNEF